MFKRLKDWVFSNPAEDHAVASFAWFGLSFLATGAATAFPALAPIAYGTAALASKVGFFEGILTAVHVVKKAFSGLFGKKAKPQVQPAPTKSTPAEPNSKSEKSKKKAKEHQGSEQDDKAIKDPQPIKTAIPGDIQENKGQVPPMIQPPKSTPKTEEEMILAGLPGIKQQGIDIPQMGQKTPNARPQSMEEMLLNNDNISLRQPQNLNGPQFVQVPSEQLFMLIQQVQILTAQVRQIQLLTAQVRQMQQELLALRLENQKLKQLNRPEINRVSHRSMFPRRRLFIHHHYIQHGF